MTLVRGWMSLATHYRWFVAFGLAWFAIVLSVVPIVSDLGDVGAAAPDQVRGALGVVSVIQTPAANALTGGDARFDPGAMFDPGPGSGFTFDDGGGASEPPPPPPPPEEPPAGCAADEQLPAPVATTVVGALGSGQTGVEDVTGQPAPADVAGTVGGAAGCPAAPAAGSSQVVGGLRPVDLLFLLWGLPAPPR